MKMGRLSCYLLLSLKNMVNFISSLIYKIAKKEQMKKYLPSSEGSQETIYLIPKENRFGIIWFHDCAVNYIMISFL